MNICFNKITELKFKLIILFFLCSFNMLGQTLDQYFINAEIKGSISLYDLNSGTWIHSNEGLATTGSLPASTFKILHTLIGLEENVVHNKNDVFKWDGSVKLFKNVEIPNWNMDNDLESAFKNSTVWYYEEISKQIAKKKYSKYLRENKYSNRKIRNGEGSDFWNYGDLEITPIEQIELLIKLYHDNLSFKKEHQALTKELMVEIKTSEFTLLSKTGWCYDEKDIGWYVGYLELEDNVVFFATRIEKELDENVSGFSKLRKTLTKDILSKIYDVQFN